MPRLLMMIALFVGAFAVINIISRINRPPRPKDTWRSHSGSSNTSSKPDRTSDDVETISSMPLSRARSLRDALTGAPIDPQNKVWQCTQCQTVYNDVSIQALVKDNQGRCVQCNHSERCLVVFTSES